MQIFNLTLALFFAFIGTSMIFWGTLSDKYGHRPILFTGTAIYVLASLLCALAGDVYELILFRIIQAIGGGATVTVSMACMKDLFKGKERERALATGYIYGPSPAHQELFDYSIWPFLSPLAETAESWYLE